MRSSLRASRSLLAPALLAVASAGACGRSDVGRGGADADASADDGGGSGRDAPLVDVSAVDGDPGPQLDVPPIDLGADAIRHWERWPYQRIGLRAVMRSTYDRAGGNEAADASHFLRATDAYDVPLDVAGPGALVFVRTNHWHGSPWHYVVDGQDTVVTETNTQTPDAPTTPATLLPASAFPAALAPTWPATHGADLSWVPVTFTSSLLLGYGRNHYGTGYYVVDLVTPGATNLSQPLAAWSAQPPPQDVVDLVARAGQDIAPSGTDVTAQTGQVDLAAGATATIASLTGPSTIRALRFTVPLGEEQAFGRGRIRITWDGRAAPSVDAPLSLFFGTGSLYDRDQRPWLVQALPVHVRFDAASVELATYFPMPFFRSARVEIAAQDAVPGVAWEVRTQPYTDPPSWVGYFHATYRDQGTPTPGQDLVLLDTTQEEGGGDWSGSFVGTSFVFSDGAGLATLEGDPRFFFDDSQTPQGQGTGTEEWAGGGDYWDGGQTMTLAFAGHPVGAPSPAAANAEDLVESAYRYLLSDAMPFGKNARIQLEHGGVDESTEHYRTLALWYGLPGASLVRTDALHVGDAADEAAHRYVSPDASPVESLTSRYEWGVDHVGSTETYPATTDTGRHTTGTSEFTIALTPKNYGVLLRRKLDYAYPDQRAVVSVADDRDGAPWAAAGTWYLAGGSAVLYANAATETGSDPGTVESSPHRWRDDDLLLPRQLTEGRASVRVRVAFAPASQPLRPGDALATQAWSEYRYTAYCWVLPPAP